MKRFLILIPLLIKLSSYHVHAQPLPVILSRPGPAAVHVKFGEHDLSILFVRCDGKLYSQKINAKGIISWLSPQKPPKPGL